MEPILQTNLFFFITAIAVIVVGSAVAALLIYLALLARDLRAITARIKTVGDDIAKHGGTAAGAFFGWLMNKFGVSGKKVARSKQQK